MTTPDQYSFDFEVGVEAGIIARDIAIDNVMAHAELEFIMAGCKAIKECCETMPAFTTDDIWARIPEDIKPHEPRVMVMIMKYASRECWAQPLDHFEPSKRPEAHRGPKRVWRSNLYDWTDKVCEHLITSPVPTYPNRYMCDLCLIVV